MSHVFIKRCDPVVDISACQECQQESFLKLTSIFSCHFLYTFWIFSQKRLSKKFCWWEIDLKTGPTQKKVNILHCPIIDMWGVYPEAMAWNICAVHSDFNLVERIWRSSPQRANLKVHLEICSLGATSPDMLTQIELRNK